MVWQEGVGPFLDQRSPDVYGLSRSAQRLLASAKRAEPVAEIVEASCEVGHERVGPLPCELPADFDGLESGSERRFRAPDVG